MRKLAVFLTILMVISLSGCVFSINSFYTEESKIVAPDDILGTWYLTNIGTDEIRWQPYTFTKEIIETTTKSEGESILDAKYFKIGNDIFLDVTFNFWKYGKNNYWALEHLLQRHSLLKVNFENDLLYLTPLSEGWISEMIEKKEITIPHFLTGSDNEYVNLTASSIDLMAFVKLFKNNPKVFPKDESYILSRKKQEKVK